MKKTIILIIFIIIYILTPKTSFAEDKNFSTPPESGTYSYGTITAYGGCIISSGKNVKFVADNRIVLKHGFKSLLGSKFYSSINGYTPPPEDDPPTDYEPQIDRDSDNDGLLDEWELKHIGNLSQSWNDDHDNNGIINGIEYKKWLYNINLSINEESSIYYDYDNFGRIKSINRGRQ